MADGDLLFQKVFGAWKNGGEQTKKWIARKIGVNNDENSVRNELHGMDYDEINEVINMLGLMKEGLQHLDNGTYNEDVDTECGGLRVNKTYNITNGDNTNTIKIVSINGDRLQFRVEGLHAEKPRTATVKKFNELMCSGKIVPTGLAEGVLSEDEEFFDEGPQPGDADYHNQKYNQDGSGGSLTGMDWRVFYDDLLNNNNGGNENMSDFCEAFEIDMDGLEFIEERGLIDIVHGMPMVDVNKYPNWQAFKKSALEAIARNPEM